MGIVLHTFHIVGAREATRPNECSSSLTESQRSSFNQIQVGNSEAPFPVCMRKDNDIERPELVELRFRRIDIGPMPRIATSSTALMMHKDFEDFDHSIMDFDP